MKINYSGLNIDVEIIGGFKLNDKDYAVCSYADSSDNYKIVIVETVRTGDKIEVKEIPDNEINVVLDRYRELEKHILGGDHGE